MSRWRPGDPHPERFDNPPELVEALARLNFPATYDASRLSDYMFDRVLEEWDAIKREKEGLPPLPKKTLGDVFRERDEQAAIEAARKKEKEPVKCSKVKSSLTKLRAIVAKFRKPWNSTKPKG